jgi:hypothetical protein
MIIHELAHVKDEIKESEYVTAAISGRTPKREAMRFIKSDPHQRHEYKERVREFTGSVLPAMGGLYESGTTNYESYYGPKYGYGIVPRDILQVDLIMCGRCGFLDTVRPHDERSCPKHGHTMTKVRKLTPEEVIATQTAIDRYGSTKSQEYQAYMRNKFKRYIPAIDTFSEKYQRARKIKIKTRRIKRTPGMLDKAQHIVGGRKLLLRFR